MDKKIDAVLRELWDSTLDALARLGGRDERFGAWKLKSGYISYDDNSAHLRFKNLCGRTKDASISLAGGPAAIDDQLTLKLRALVS